MSKSPTHKYFSKKKTVVLSVMIDILAQNTLLTFHISVIGMTQIILKNNIKSVRGSPGLQLQNVTQIDMYCRKRHKKATERHKITTKISPILSPKSSISGTWVVICSVRNQ